MDIVARTDFYVDRGFDPNLTDFPAAAFNEGLDLAGIRPAPSLVALYGPPVPPSNDPEVETAFQRTNTAHDWLQRLETSLRAFINTRMMQAHGEHWPKQRTPAGLHDKWKEKKLIAEKAGRPSRPLIEYAHFTEYVEIVCRADNWPLFVSAFRNQASFRESMQRLYPIRIATMPARIITQSDELYLYVEVRRLTEAMK